MQVFSWHKAFREGSEEVEDEQYTSFPSTSYTTDNVAKVNVVMDCNWCVRLISNEVELQKSITHEIVMTDLEMWKVYAKLVPKVLMTNKQKENCIDFSWDFGLGEKWALFILDWVITGYETRVSKYNLEMKKQISEWHTTEPP